MKQINQIDYLSDSEKPTKCICIQSCKKLMKLYTSYMYAKSFKSLWIKGEDLTLQFYDYFIFPTQREPIFLRVLNLTILKYLCI